MTCLTGQASRMPQLQAYSEAPDNSVAGQNPSHEKDLEFFSKIWVFRFHVTQFGYLFTSGSFSREGYSEGFATPHVTDLRVELPITDRKSVV